MSDDSGSSCSSPWALLSQMIKMTGKECFCWRARRCFQRIFHLHNFAFGPEWSRRWSVLYWNHKNLFPGTCVFWSAPDIPCVINYSWVHCEQSVFVFGEEMCDSWLLGFHGWNEHWGGAREVLGFCSVFFSVFNPHAGLGLFVKRFTLSHAVAARPVL